MSKANAYTHKIIGKPGEWVVVEKATGKTVAGPLKTFKGIRTAHARITLKIPHRTAARMGNG
jgi:hypothetical protein